MSIDFPNTHGHSPIEKVGTSSLPHLRCAPPFDILASGDSYYSVPSVTQLRNCAGIRSKLSERRGKAAEKLLTNFRLRGEIFRSRFTDEKLRYA